MIATLDSGVLISAVIAVLWTISFFAVKSWIKGVNDNLAGLRKDLSKAFERIGAIESRCEERGQAGHEYNRRSGD
jgi:hypothetical protein